MAQPWKAFGAEVAKKTKEEEAGTKAKEKASLKVAKVRRLIPADGEPS